jgi:large subunit ribosomal protein L13
MTTKTKKAPAKKTAKKTVKAQKSAKKAAAKTQVRTSRTTVRATKEAAKKREGAPSVARWKEKHVGHAPQSARITPPKGPVKPIAAKTSFAPDQNEDRSWLLIDAAGQTVGRLATQIASLLRGKHKSSFTPNNDAGDFVIVINAEKVKFTGAKEDQKAWYKHTGYIGGIKEITVKRVRKEHPERILEYAVDGMIPHGPLGRSQMKKLKIYAGAEHPHTAQNPIVWNLRYNSNIVRE